MIQPKNKVKNEKYSYFYNNKYKFQRIILEYEIAKHGECLEHPHVNMHSSDLSLEL